MNAIILAGDRKGASPLRGMNKAFLLLEGWPLFGHVLAALNQSSQIETVYIIGPRKAIMEALEKALPAFLFTKQIEVLEQKDSLLENIQTAYGQASQISFDHPNPPALFLPSDIPLVTAAEIDAFILMSDMSQYDYCLGVTSSEHLKQFYPTFNAPGMKMPYLYLKENIYRMNNLHIARLSCKTTGSMIQTIYHHRRQINIWNRVKMVYALFTADHGRSLLGLYLLAQCAVLLSRFSLHRIAHLFRKPLLLDRVEREVSSVLQMRFKAVEINIGGAALDIDDEVAYKIISATFKQWHEALMPKQTDRRNAQCPFQAECHKGAPPAGQQPSLGT